MLKLIISVPERWDNKSQTFIPGSHILLKLEHSLVSISKWESKWHKPFLSSKDKTSEELLDYIRCMTIEPDDPDPGIYEFLTNREYQIISDYISDPMSATWFNKNSQDKRSSEQITSELIYYWMISLGIPSEYQNWHLNRLLTLIKICGIKNQGQNKHKMTSSDLAARSELNAARRKQLKTHG